MIILMGRVTAAPVLLRQAIARNAVLRGVLQVPDMFLQPWRASASVIARDWGGLGW
ncbi:hypothetical protein BOSE62_71421 [Bosea sp. 62]|nr:hypothetical protein BOSE21B_90196 [Bosea sp. 21B]CAD5294708.1 hypothetical protein BOSE46_80301 [Bosea sp. 46]CAD5298893.1 hypothetical protein BOSE7B_60467 [Bosea sp. 7B]VVT60843.1 hypothetical protein BOS5A_230120 [Bosea sp. EC-HK365B]VXB39203.1 hypothetical protein BOSE127_110466 [Bosea sp. 127]VXB55066.1 hypothetical protein BOSE125_131049 [Bosea sp. 125]VXC74786.1 hypothetical protein BOSE29B_80191 [Bosea sp. 29B]VXC91478.1 hypothetical protein BOSE62_71421 [Bosea sp. 62]